jgi:hypothetical protein
MIKIKQIIIITTLMTLMDFSVSAQTENIPAFQPQTPGSQNQIPQITPVQPSHDDNNATPALPNNNHPDQNLQRSEFDKSINNPNALNGDPQNLQDTSPAIK